MYKANEENSNRKPVFNKSISIKRLSESVNIATVRLLLKSETNTEMETNFRILPIYFFWHKNVRVAVKLEGRSIGNTYFFLALYIMLCMFLLYLRLFDKIKHVKILSECINVVLIYRPELCFITRLIIGTVP
jgi:hypothetical protein